MAKKSPEINAGSMADIAFLLLIFFLVTTTMSSDNGIQRVLPPWIDKDSAPIKNKERNTLVVKVSGSDQILVGGRRVDLSGVKDITKEFITNPAQSETLPEVEIKEIDIIGPFPVNKGVISLQNDVSTSYDVYLAVQNELTRAYNEVRNQVSNRFFNQKYSELTEEQKKALNEAVPVQISEAEPVDLTGKKK